MSEPNDPTPTISDPPMDEAHDAPVESQPSEKLVPVSESIRYRRRAQIAEQQLKNLQAQLDEASAELATNRDQLAAIELRQQIDEQLIHADAVDLEAARLLTEHAINQMDDAQVSEVVADLKRHKPYLFTHAHRGSSMSPRLRDVDNAMDEAAAHAATTGDRRDLLRYLRCAVAITDSHFQQLDQGTF